MTCCGKRTVARPDLRQNVRYGDSRRTNAGAGNVQFEYTGTTRFSVRGPATGRRYDFLRPGDVLEVDGHDAPFFNGLSQLKIR